MKNFWLRPWVDVKRGSEQITHKSFTGPWVDVKGDLRGSEQIILTI